VQAAEQVPEAAEVSELVAARALAAASVPVSELVVAGAEEQVEAVVPEQGLEPVAARAMVVALSRRLPEESVQASVALDCRASRLAWALPLPPGLKSRAEADR
jgi:hypothetical protein